MKPSKIKVTDSAPPPQGPQTRPTMGFHAKLVSLGACVLAQRWADLFETPADAWAACKRGDWMLWILGKHSGAPMSDARRPLVLAACECARTAPQSEQGSATLDLAERWANGGEVSRCELADAAAYAADAYDSAAADAAAYAADAADAADAAFDASDAAAAASDAAYAAADAAAYAAYDDAAATARETTLVKCADIVRKHFPTPPI